MLQEAAAEPHAGGQQRNGRRGKSAGIPPATAEARDSPQGKRQAGETRKGGGILQPQDLRRLPLRRGPAPLGGDAGDYLKRGTFIGETKNLILYGNVGTGKTHLATAIGIEACGRGLSVGFHRTASLVNRLSEAKKTGQIGKLFASLRKLDLLICDEWGYVPLDREAAQLLFQVISDSYERRSVIITTNLEFSRWVGIFYDEQMTAAIIDRLIHHSYLVLFDGPSNRVRDSLMRVNA